MSRTWLRVVGISLGILFGSVVAMATKIYRSKPSQGLTYDAASTLVEAELEALLENPGLQTLPPDPGRRRTLASLVESAKKEPRLLQEFEFTDQRGEKVTSESLRGQPYVACFFFTTCKGSCPRQSSQMQLLSKKYKNKPIRFVSITVDPEVDKPEVLAAYAGQFSADPEKWKFLWAPMDYTQRVAVEKFFLDGVETRGHPDRFCLVNSSGDIEGSYVWLDVEERDLLEKHVAELLSKN